MKFLALLLILPALLLAAPFVTVDSEVQSRVSGSDLIADRDGDGLDSSLVAKAFPGAVGFGADAVGGRGGTVYTVTNLSDSGAGSFRAAVEASGSRIVVFETSGIINLQSPLTISNPNITIAGQTSPGGILVTGHPTRIAAAEVIIRHMRFRVGSHETTVNGGTSNPDQHDALQIWGNGAGDASVSNIILDHVSVGWGIDENIEFAYNPANITIMNSLISEGLTNAGHSEGNHSMGMLVWNQQSPDTNLTLYNNFFAHNRDRNPEVQASTNGRTEVINNISFHPYGGIVMTSYDYTRINWIGNYARRGPQTNANAWEILHYGTQTPQQYVYVDGNRGLNDGHPNEWRVADDWDYTQQSNAWQRSTPWSMSTTPVTPVNPSSASWADNMVLSVGATIPSRDAIDQRAIDDFLASASSPTGSYVADVTYPTDFPTFTNPSPPTDSDNDGMADAWEASQGLNVGADDSATIEAGEVYTNIERYINGLADGSWSNS